MSERPHIRSGWAWAAHRQPHDRAVHRQRAEPSRQHLVQPFKLGPKGSAYSLPGITSRQHNTGIAQSRAHLELGCTKLRLPEINRHPQYRAPLCVAALQKGRGGRTTECIMLVRRGSVLCLVLLCEVVTRHVCAVRWSVMRAVCDVRRCVLRGGVSCAAVCAVRWAPHELYAVVGGASSK